MRAREIRGRAVVTLADAARIGSIEDVLFDPRYQRVVGFVLANDTLPDSKVAVLRGRVTSIGEDTVTVSSSEAIVPTDRFPELRSARSLKQARGAKIVMVGDTLVASLDGFELDIEARVVRAWVIAAPLKARLRHPHADRLRQIEREKLTLVDEPSFLFPRDEAAKN